MPTKNWLEWTVFGLSLVLVATVLSYLGFNTLTRGDAPPQLIVELGEATPGPSGYTIPVTVTNTGDSTAEGVQVEVVLERNGAEIDAGTFEIAFVPHDSQGEGWVVLKENPADGVLTGMVSGYAQP